MKRWICMILLLSLLVALVGCAEEPSGMTSEPTQQTAADPTLDRQELANWRNYFRELARSAVQSEDGAAVLVTVPDFAALLEKVPEDTDTAVMTAEQWETLAAQYPELVKEYALTVENFRDVDVYEALCEQILLELFVATAGKAELDFSDPATRGGTAQ